MTAFGYVVNFIIFQYNSSVAGCSKNKKYSFSFHQLF